LGVAKPTNPTADLNLAALVVTLAWLAYVLFQIAHPFTAIAVDPGASLRSTASYSGLWTALAAPFIAALVLAALMTWRTGGRFRITQLHRAAHVPSLWVLALVLLVWVAASLVVASEPGPGFTLGLPWLLFTGLLGIGWFVCTTHLASATLKEPRSRDVAMTLVYAVLLPLAAIPVYRAFDTGAAVETRFQMSEGALARYVEEFELTGEDSMPTVQMVGLYQVSPPDRRHGCIRVTTNSEMDYYSGFAYCPAGPLPTGPNEEFHHFRGNWWRFAVHH
jgi:hypothetical protein